MAIEKFCTRCGHKFLATGREVICPSCKQAAAEDAKRAAVLKAKRASWNGESVPVRISGRASTVIRKYGAANNMPFAQALDELLKASDYFKSVGQAWEDVEPYKSHRRDKHATESTTENTNKPQEAQVAKQEEVKQEEVKQAAKVASKTSKASTNKKAVKTAAGKKVKE